MSWLWLPYFMQEYFKQCKKIPNEFSNVSFLEMWESGHLKIENVCHARVASLEWRILTFGKFEITLKVWKFKVLKLQNFETSELWSFGTLDLWNFRTFSTSDLWNFRNLGILKLRNFETSELWIFGTFETFWFLKMIPQSFQHKQHCPTHVPKSSNWFWIFAFGILLYSMVMDGIGWFVLLYV